MNKRKGRKPTRSEIKSVLRAPPDGENELEAEGSISVDADSDTLPLDVLAEVMEPEAAPTSEASAAESEPAPPAESAAGPRPRRLRAVRAGDTDARSDAGNEGDGDEYASERDADGSEPVAGGEGDAETAEAGGDPFAPFPMPGEGDDTEEFLRGLLEALLFTSQKPLELKDLARSAGIDKPRAKELLDQLMSSFEGRGVCIEQVAGGFVMRSSPRYAPYIQKILALRPVRLSRAQLETLAIVAYRQPVTKPEVDDIRGVDSGQVIKGLLERSLLKMLGKKDEPGRPTLYGTTNDFLELLNLQSLKDLPTLREYTELSEESQRKFLDETGETPPSGAISFERPASSGTEGSGSDSEEATQPNAPPEAGATFESSSDDTTADQDSAPALDEDDDGTPPALDEDDDSTPLALDEDRTPAASAEDEEPADDSDEDDDDSDEDDDDDSDEDDDDDSDEDDDDDSDEDDDDDSDEDDDDDSDEDDDDDSDEDDDDDSDEDDDDDDSDEDDDDSDEDDDDSDEK